MKQSSCVQGECVREKNAYVENMSRQHNTKFVCGKYVTSSQHEVRVCVEVGRGRVRVWAGGEVGGWRSGQMGGWLTKKTKKGDDAGGTCKRKSVCMRVCVCKCVCMHIHKRNVREKVCVFMRVCTSLCAGGGS